MAQGQAHIHRRASLLNRLISSLSFSIQIVWHDHPFVKIARLKTLIQSLLIALMWATFSTTAMSFPAAFELNTLDGTNGFTLDVGGNFGAVNVNTIGDLNADGIDDIAVSIPNKAQSSLLQAGEVFVVFGKNGGFTSPINLTALNGSDGFVIKGKNIYDLIGNAISSAGDINGDGINDLVIGDSHFDPAGRINAGTCFVIFGKNTAFSSIIDVTTLNGADGFAINGVVAFDNAGSSISPAGDINGDGIADLIIGAELASPGGRASAGTSYVVFGKNTGFVANFELSTLNGSNGFIINGATAGDYAGHAVSNAGDINGDGIADVIIGAYRAQPGGKSVAGTSYVVFGKNMGFAAALELSTLNGTNGFAINGIAVGDFSGGSVSDAGDLNGDGISDVIIGAGTADPIGRPNAGASYVVYGKNTAFTSVLELSTLDGTNGFVINGVTTEDRAGAWVSNAGDINSDGFSDVVIGAFFADPGGKNSAGTSYVVFGKNTAFTTPYELSTLNGSNGFAINGVAANDSSGTVVNNAGDVNGDGIADIIIGGTRQLSNHVVFGTPSNLPPVAKNDAVATNNNAILNANVLANNGAGVDSDPDSDPLSVSKVNTLSGNVGGQITLASGALLSVNANGTFAYDPNGQFNALAPNASTSDGFTYTISDGKGGTASATVTITINGINHLPTGTLVITGTVAQGQTLTANTSAVADADGLGAFTYQWRRDGWNILGQDHASYVLTQADVGATIAVAVDYTDGGGKHESVVSAPTAAVANTNDAPTGTVAITGTPRQGQILSADASAVADVDGLGTLNYQWKRGGSNIAGATATTYTLVQGDVGYTITITVSYTDGGGTNESVTSAATSTIQGIYTLTVATTGLGSGTISSSPVGINCGTNCSESYDQGTSISLSIAAAGDSTFARWSGDCTGTGACNITMDANHKISARFELSAPKQTTLFSSILPSARSGSYGGSSGPAGTDRPAAIGNLITVFASIINAGTDPAQSCSISVAAGAPVTLSYQETDADNAPIGAADTPFDLSAGQTRSFVLALTPIATSTGKGVFPEFTCDNANVDAIPGVNTVFLSIDDHEVPDILSIGTTPSGDGIITIPTGGTGFMTASSINIGAGDVAGSKNAAMTISIDTGATALGIQAQFCETDAASTCITPLGTGPIKTVVGHTPNFFAVFLSDQSNGTGIPLDPANARVFLRFSDSRGTVRSVISAAITVPAAAAEALMAASELPIGRWAVMVRETQGIRHAQEPGTLYVWPDGTAALQRRDQTMAINLFGASAGRFSGREDMGVLAGQYIPNHSITLVDVLNDNARLDIWGVHDTRGLTPPN